MYNACYSFHVIYILHCFIQAVIVSSDEHASDKKLHRKNSRLKTTALSFLGTVYYYKT